MLFKHPSVLYTLFALLIPIIIHLFKLRRFKKVAFTNVAFLEKIKLQTRKSSQLKKWLVLAIRLLLFTSIILAFAEPYFPSESNTPAPKEYIIYLDNSFSMEAKGSNGPLLKRAIQELIEQVDENQIISLFTNNEVYKNIRFSEIQNDLLDIPYTPEQLSPKQISLKFRQLAKNSKSNLFVAISDFQEHSNYDFSALSELNIHFIKAKPQEFSNVSIDSLWTTKNDNELLLNIDISSTNFSETSSLSVHNGENLIGKIQVDFSTQSSQTTQVSIPKKTAINGSVKITGDGLNYDNTRYFSINKPERAKVLAIGDTDAVFLKKIYTEEEFEFSNSTLSNLNYAKLSEVNTIILNELNNFPKPLEENLKAFVNKGGTLTVIPSKDASAELKGFLKGNYNIALGVYTKTEKKLTHISYENPIFNNVFTKKISNFQYPTTNESYQLQGQQSILLLEDNSPFLTQSNNVFVFAAPLNIETTNFKQSPIIVPCFYNIAKQNSSVSRIDYTIGETNEINILSSQQNQEDVLEIRGTKEQFIPLQQIYQDYVRVITNDLPKNAGNYTVDSKSKIISTLSFNYPTKESHLKYASLTNIDKVTSTDSVFDYFSRAKASFEITELWKWFLIFALIFIGIEILLLKFLK